MTAEAEKNRAANLGCGTLILIAIIVAIFSGRGRLTEIDARLRSLEARIARIDQKVDRLVHALEKPESEREK